MPKKETLEKLSRQERRLYKLLPEDGTKMTTSQLVFAFYGGDVPDNGRVIVTGLIRVVQRKTDKMEFCPFKLCASERSGPKPIWVWLETKSLSANRVAAA